VASRYPLVAHEGWTFIGVALAIASVLAIFVSYIYAVPLLLLAFVLMYFYRDPPRRSPPLPLAVICPVDGYINKIEEARDPWLERPARCISINMSRHGVYSIRSPIEGKVQEQWNPDVAAGYYAMWVQSDEQDDVTWGIETRGPRGPECYVQPGERVGQGQRCGFFIPGTSVDMYLPLNSRVDVEVGQRVLSGESVVVTLVHNRGATIMIEEVEH